MAFSYLPGGKKMSFENIGWASPACQIYSTIDDLAKLGVGNDVRSTRQAKLFKPATLRAMMTPKDITPDSVTVWGSPFEMVFKEHLLIRTKGGLIASYQEGSCSYVTFIIIPKFALGANILVSTFYFGCSVGYKGSVLLDNGLVTALNETNPVRATTLVPLPCNRHPTLENLR